MARKIKLTADLAKGFSKKRTPKRPRYIEGRILVVCEGVRTEPNYFRSFNKKHNGVFVVDMDFAGGGINTIQVVDEAIRLKMKAEKGKKPYDAVWAVFDKDSFLPGRFNAAIMKAEANGISVAWSNEAFELWYLLHFEYRNTGMSRTEYQDAIVRHINAALNYKSKKTYKYKKNDAQHYAEMTTYGDMEQAIENAKNLDTLYNDQQYAKHNPRTLVYKLVVQLLGRDKEFNDKLVSGL